MGTCPDAVAPAAASASIPRDGTPPSRTLVQIGATKSSQTYASSEIERCGRNRYYSDITLRPFGLEPTAGLARKGDLMASEKIIQAKSGWAMLAVNVIVYAASCAGIVYSIVLLASADDASIEAPDFAVPLMIAGFVLLALGVVLSSGFITLKPGEAKVCLLFGNYIGTIRESGFYWANPFYNRQMGTASPDEETAEEAGKKGLRASKTPAGISTKISLRARTHNGERIKVNAPVALILTSLTALPSASANGALGLTAMSV